MRLPILAAVAVLSSAPVLADDMFQQPLLPQLDAVPSASSTRVLPADLDADENPVAPSKPVDPYAPLDAVPAYRAPVADGAVDYAPGIEEPAGGQGKKEIEDRVGDD